MPHTAARGELSLEFHGAVGRVASLLTLQTPGHSWGRDLPQKHFTSGKGLWYRAGLQPSPRPPVFLQGSMRTFSVSDAFFLTMLFGVYFCFTASTSVVSVFQMSGRKRIEKGKQKLCSSCRQAIAHYCIVTVISEVFYDTVAFLRALSNKKRLCCCPF